VSEPTCSLESSEHCIAAWKPVLFEGLLIAVAGAVLSFSANWLATQLTRHSSSPMGLELCRNYFPEAGTPSPAGPADANLHSQTGGSTNAALEPLRARLRSQGLRLADSNQVSRLFQDPRRELNLVVFVDAREDPQQYHEGHVPGAYFFNHYHPDTYLGAVLPACQIAQEVVVYCTGGECEDSQFAAVMLRDAGIANDKIQVYGGGITEWVTNGWPVELGERNSGQIRQTRR